ncbi:hypothetical protein [Sphingorhabdus sp. SMR4y]|uniref:hypothetical protein n=1 Tax=Sphingorhabdus sp. SMR4y TaxID=2584094 RepID=UPI000B5FB18C|nr:hypothetical protein [Sphingorhabdus sp. SMR4y]ASK88465.1 hypothetical protein SPHFLASMR4Y_01718 [Sphingorhabdus sp. SMR4y]
MTTCRDIITQAMYRTSILALGRTPKAKEATNGLFILQGLYDELIDAGCLGGLNDVYAEADYTAKEFDRISANGFTITKPLAIEEDGQTREPKDLAVISIYDSGKTNYVWDNGWVSLSGLTLDTDAPFASRGADGLACYLASNWVDTFGGQVSPTVYRRGLAFKGLLMGSNATAATAADYF